MGAVLGRLWIVALFKIMPQNLSRSAEEKHEKLSCEFVLKSNIDVIYRCF
jgi:hypothetical protein